MINLQNVYDAQNRVMPFIRSTPVISEQLINKYVGCEVFFKLESLQVTHAFKVRGSANKILQLSSKEKERGIITASTGNHGQGFSYIAQKVGINATVVVPSNASKKKIAAIKSFGATIKCYGNSYDEASLFAHQLAEEEKRVYIHSFDDEDIIAGNGTISLELLRVIPDLQCIVVPIGGGGLISGISFVAKKINPRIKIIGVQSSGAPSMHNSYTKKKIVTLKSISTIADGIAVKRPGEINFEYVSRFVDDIILVNDEEIISTIKFLHEYLGVVVEGAGAAAFASILHKRLKPKNKTVCIVSGGNIDLDLLLKIISKK